MKGMAEFIKRLRAGMSHLFGATVDASKNVTFSGGVTVGGNFIADPNQQKTGWALDIRDDITLAFDDGSRTLTVTGAEDYYIQDVKYTVSSPDTVTIDDTEGLWYIYYDGAALTASQTPWHIGDNDIALVAMVYWDATNKTAVYFQWEMHSWLMDAATHDELHDTVRTMFASGFGMTDNADGTVDLSIGIIYDEDIEVTTIDGAGAGMWEQPHTPIEAPVFYLNGAGADVRSAYNDTSNAYICLQDGSDNPYWNEFTGGAWQNTASQANRYMAMWLIATPCLLHPLMWIMGQVEPTVKLTDAIDDNPIDSVSWAALPFQEIKVLYRVIVKNAGAPYTVSQIDDFRAVTGVAVSGGITQSHASHPDLTTSGHPADIINVNTTNFDGVLSAADDEVQAALDTLDDIVLAKDGTVAMTDALNVGTHGLVNTGPIAGATTIDASGTITTDAQINFAVGGSPRWAIIMHDATGELRIFSYSGGIGNVLAFVYATGVMRIEKGLNINNQTVTNLPAGSATGHPVEYDQARGWVVDRAKPDNEVVNNSVALQDDDDLTFSVPAGTTWNVKLILHLTTTAVANWKFNFNCPNCSMFGYGVVYQDVSGAKDASHLGPANDNLGNFFAPGEAASWPVVFDLRVKNTTESAETFKLQWAQDTAEATDTTVHQGSYLAATRVG